jgi:hypothetical protein
MAGGSGKYQGYAPLADFQGLPIPRSLSTTISCFGVSKSPPIINMDHPNIFLQNLKSAEELESEDREAQSAKLQELIRRGTPRDLAAAQELMKTLAGADPEAKPDYRSQALTDLNKLEHKVILMNEMLDNADTTRGERFATGDVYDVSFFLPMDVCKVD